jgi:hypothetical protein
VRWNQEKTDTPNRNYKVISDAVGAQWQENRVTEPQIVPVGSTLVVEFL